MEEDDHEEDEVLAAWRSCVGTPDPLAVDCAAVVTKSDAGMANPDAFFERLRPSESRDSAPSIPAARRLSAAAAARAVALEASRSGRISAVTSSSQFRTRSVLNRVVDRPNQSKSRNRI